MWYSGRLLLRESQVTFCGHWKLTIDPTRHCNIMVWLLYIELVNNFVKNTSLACCPSIFINFWKNKIHCFRINCFQLQIIHVKKIEYYLLKNGVTLTNHILHFILYYIFHGLSSFRLVLYATFVFWLNFTVACSIELSARILRD